MSAAPLWIGVMAALFGWSVGSAVDGMSPTVGALVMAAVGLGTGVIALIRPSGPEATAWRRIEVVVVMLGAIGLHLSLGGSLDRLPLIAVVLVALLVRSVADSSMLDAQLTQRITDERAGSGPVRRIRTRIVAWGVVLAGVSGYAEAARVGLLDLTRDASARIMIPVVAWFAVGLGAIGASSLGAHRWRWDRDGYEVDEDLGDRWIAGILVGAMLLTGVALAVPLLFDGASALPARGIASAGGFGRWVSDQLERLGDLPSEGGEQDASAGEADAPASEFDGGAADPPEWLGDALLAALIASVFVWAVRAGRRAAAGIAAERGRPTSWGEVGDLVRALLADLWRSLAAMFRFFRRIRLPGAPGGADDGSQPGPGVRRDGWSPDDLARRRVAQAFGRVADLVAPRPAETPADVGSELSAEGHDQAGTVVDTYRRARFSRHPIEEAEADRAEEAARAVLRDREEPEGR